MTSYVAFLRAVNVGGTGKLPMAELRKMCEDLGFGDVRTYIASGNVLFTSNQSKSAVKSALENRLQRYAGKPVGVVVRTAAEVRTLLDNNPFPASDPKTTVAILLDRKPAQEAVTAASGQADEKIRVGRCEIYVHYPKGIGQSKLRLKAAKEGTARNMNTLAKLAELSST